MQNAQLQEAKPVVIRAETEGDAAKKAARYIAANYKDNGTICFISGSKELHQLYIDGVVGCDLTCHCLPTRSVNGSARIVQSAMRCVPSAIVVDQTYPMDTDSLSDLNHAMETGHAVVICGAGDLSGFDLP